MCSVRSLAAVAFLATALAAQSGTFEACPPGPVAGGCAPEPWSATGGTLTAEPDGSLIPGPVGGFPTEGNQWIILSPEGASPHSGTPGGGPAAYPINPGQAGSLVFANVVLGTTISFDWNYINDECANDPIWNDFFTVDIVHPVSGQSVANILYRDTWSTTYDVVPAVSPDHNGGVPVNLCLTGASEEAPVGTAKTMVYTVPAALVGLAMNVEFHVANTFDVNYPSYAYLDNIQLGSQAAPFAVSLSSPAGAGSLQVDNTGLTVGTATYNIFTVNEPCPGGPGTGPFLGLCTTNPQFLIDQFNSGLPPFAFLATGPTRSWGPITGLPSGMVLECVSFEFPGLTNVSPVAFHIVP